MHDIHCVTSNSGNILQLTDNKKTWEIEIYHGLDYVTIIGAENSIKLTLFYVRVWELSQQ